jgi:hypothetical protein
MEKGYYHLKKAIDQGRHDYMSFYYVGLYFERKGDNREAIKQLL